MKRCIHKASYCSTITAKAWKQKTMNKGLVKSPHYIHMMKNYVAVKRSREYLFIVMWAAPQTASRKSKEEKNVPEILSSILKRKK